MMRSAKILLGAAAIGCAVQGASNLAWADGAEKFAGLDMASGKIGSLSELLPMSQFCGTKKIRVAQSDGWGGNYWRHIARQEFADEAKKCPNITEVRYVDAEGNPQKQIADIQGLIAQHFDVIVVGPDGGPVINKAMRQAMDAGIAVVPIDTGNDWPGEAGKDYVVAVSADTHGIGAASAEWMAKTLNGKGNIIIFGGTPGNAYDVGLEAGRRPVFAKYPGIKVLEGPVTTNWDPALAQKATTAMIAKYPEIDGVYSETTGPIRAFVAANKPIPVWGGQDLNELSCLWEQYHPTNPNFKMATLGSHPSFIRIALRKAVAAAQGLSDPEPSLITVPFSEDSTSTDPALAVKCDKSMPLDSIPSSTLTKDEQRQALGQ
jgi:ribose transport system substrate-binding protein